MSIVNLSNKNFEEVTNTDKKVLIDFYADWCGPCQMVSPLVEEISEERDDIIVCKVNVDEESFLASQFRVVSIPMLVLMQDGDVVRKTVGAMPKEEIEQFIEG